VLKGLLLDFYGTVVEEDDEVVAVDLRPCRCQYVR
jgi:hypothetical protein